MRADIPVDILAVVAMIVVKSVLLIIALFCFQLIVRFAYCTEITELVRIRKRASFT